MQKNKLSLEELFEIKKLEKPSTADWSEFDAQLNKKMLQSIVKKESVWESLWASSLVKVFVNVSAVSTAVFAVAFVTHFMPATNSDTSLSLVANDFIEIPNMQTSYALNNFSGMSQDGLQNVQNEVVSGNQDNIRYADAIASAYSFGF